MVRTKGRFGREAIILRKLPDWKSNGKTYERVLVEIIETGRRIDILVENLEPGEEVRRKIEGLENK